MIENDGFRRQFPTLVRHVSATELEVLTRLLTIRTVSAGTRITSEGETTPCLHLVVSGSLEVTLARRGGQVVVGKIEAGDWIGDVALLDGGPAVATTTATTETQLLELSGATFRQLDRDYPALTGQLVRAMSERLTDRLRYVGALLFDNASQTGKDLPAKSISERALTLLRHLLEPDPAT